MYAIPRSTIVITERGLLTIAAHLLIVRPKVAVAMTVKRLGHQFAVPLHARHVIALTLLILVAQPHQAVASKTEIAAGQQIEKKTSIRNINTNCDNCHIIGR